MLLVRTGLSDAMFLDGGRGIDPVSRKGGFGSATVLVCVSVCSKSRARMPLVLRLGRMTESRAGGGWLTHGPTPALWSRRGALQASYPAVHCLHHPFGLVLGNMPHRLCFLPP